MMYMWGTHLEEDVRGLVYSVGVCKAVLYITAGVLGLVLLVCFMLYIAFTMQPSYRF